ncbi:MAG: methionyl-tRNA formyltransferase [Endomicrobium sp.]|nr:methionyl-tRNA formyltransferase [Endomicrobium sp.]
MKILFFGTSIVSRYYLEELCKNNHKVLVITKSDRPAFRGRRFVFSAVKVYAIENDVDFMQVEKFTTDVIKKIKKFGADVGVVVSYGKLIPRSIFSLPKYKTFNVHFSLLPKLRGASPVQYALCNGETETGVSSFYIGDDLDSGDIIIQERIVIDVNDTAETLFSKLIPLGIVVMNKTLEFFESGEYKSTPQIGVPSFAPSLKKRSGLINWNKSASDVYNKFRGLYLWPGVYSIVSFGKLTGKRIKFIEIKVFNSDSLNCGFGIVCSIEKNRGFTVSCAAGKILVVKMKLESKPVMDAWSFVQGGQLSVGDRFSVEGM